MFYYFLLSKWFLVGGCLLYYKKQSFSPGSSDWCCVMCSFLHNLGRIILLLELPREECVCSSHNNNNSVNIDIGASK